MGIDPANVRVLLPAPEAMMSPVKVTVPAPLLEMVTDPVVPIKLIGRFVEMFTEGSRFKLTPLMLFPISIIPLVTEVGDPSELLFPTPTLARVLMVTVPSVNVVAPL